MTICRDEDESGNLPVSRTRMKDILKDWNGKQESPSL